MNNKDDDVTPENENPGLSLMAGGRHIQKQNPDDCLKAAAGEAAD
jgi:hypothetical protein